MRSADAVNGIQRLRVPKTSPELMKLSDDLACAKWLTAKRGNADSGLKTRRMGDGEEGKTYFNRLGKPDRCAFPYISAIRPGKMGKIEARRDRREPRNKMKGRIYREIYDGL